MGRTFKRQTNSSKWAGNIGNRNHHCMTLADSDFPLPEYFHQHLVGKVSNLNNLTYKNRTEEYFDSVISWYEKYHLKQYPHNGYRVKLESKHFIQSPSICNLIACAIMAFSQPNDNVLIFTPVYGFYMNAIQGLNRKVIPCGFIELFQQQWGSFTYEFDYLQFRRLMQHHKPKIILLCNPHNPSGKIFNQAETDAIVAEAKKFDTYIVSDQIMGDFTICQFQPKQTQFHTMLKKSYRKIIVANSISKAFNMESIQAGYGLIIDEEVRQQFNSVGLKVLKLLNNEMSLILTPKCYSSSGQQWLRFITQVITRNFKSLRQCVGQFRGLIKLYELESSFLTAIEVQQPKPKSGDHSVSEGFADFIKNHLLQHGIELLDMRSYYFPPTQRAVFRISIAVEPQAFDRFVSTLRPCLKELQTRLQENHEVSPKL